MLQKYGELGKYHNARYVLMKTGYLLILKAHLTTFLSPFHGFLSRLYPIGLRTNAMFRQAQHDTRFYGLIREFAYSRICSYHQSMFRQAQRDRK